MKKPGRNDPCLCGSGKKYKQCCLPRDEARAKETLTVDTSIPKLIQTAMEHHQAGRLPEAESLYQQVLQASPRNPDALHLLGLIAHQVGEDEIAVELIGKAIRVKPTAPMYSNLGLALQSQGKLDIAAAHYRKALALNPDYAGAHYNLGNLLQAQCKWDQAIASHRKALAINPDHAEAYNNLGNAFHAQGKYNAAIESYHKALRLQTDDAEVYNNLGTAFKEQGKLDTAVENYRHAIQLQPNYAEAHNNLGAALQEQGKLSGAVNCLLSAISINPGYAEAHYNLGNVFREQSRLEAAVERYRNALAIKPDYAMAYSNLGVVLKDQGKLEEAIASYRQALVIKPNYSEAYDNLLFLQGYHALLNPQDYLVLARGWEQACIPAQDRKAAQDRTFQRLPLAGRKLRVGYVSGDYRHHAVSYFVEQLFTHHDRSRIELFAYSNSSIQDTVTERLQTLADHWIPIMGISDAIIRDRIEADGIDVLIDLSGHTAHNRLGIFARRAAPVQAHYLGFMASTGLSEMDYWIGDKTLTPPETDSHFSEQVWRLPRVWVSYEGKANAPLPDWHPAQDGNIWIGSFNNLGKLTPATLALWAQLLHALPEGKLLLKTKELADASNRQRILDAMASHGIPSERIELQDSNITPGWQEHMAYYNRLDIALDPVGGMGGGTTTCDALWMGVPIITLAGDRMASRMTASMVDAIGYPEWIAHSGAEYVGKVVALARDVEQRKALRTNQRNRMASSPLCNAHNLAANLELAYVAMFERSLKMQNAQLSVTP